MAGTLAAALKAARISAGISLAEMSQRTSYSKAALGHLETGTRPIRSRHIAAYERALGIRIDRFVAASLRPRGVGTGALADIASILATTRRLEDSVGACAVLPAAEGIASMTLAIADESRGALVSRAASLASEVIQFRGHLELAIGRFAMADGSFDDAISLAETGADPDRLMHAWSFKAYGKLESGAVLDAQELNEQALKVKRAHPVLRIFEQYQRARLLAILDETSYSLVALARADRLASMFDDQLPDWGYWYTEGFWGLQRGRVLWLLGDKPEAIRQVEAGLATMPTEHREASWARDFLRSAEWATEWQPDLK